MDPENTPQTDPQPEPTPAPPTPPADNNPPVDYKALFEAEVAKHAETTKHMRHWEKIAKNSKDDNLSEALERAQNAEQELANMKAEKAHNELLAAVAAEKEVPLSVLSLMSGQTREELEACADALKSVTTEPEPKPAQNFPTIKDTGEAQNKSHLTREDIRQIKNPSERREAIRENIKLFKH